MVTKKILVVCIAAILLLTAGCKETVEITTNEAEIFGTFTKEELIKDADRFMTIIAAYSPQIYTDEEELKSKYEYAVENITDNMTGLEFMRLLKPVTAALRCGHSNIFPTVDWDNVEMMPFDIKVIDEKLFLLNRTGDSKIPIGSEIYEINGRGSKEILDTILNGVSSDGYNQTGKINILNRRFVQEYMFNIEYAEKFEIRYRTSDRTEKRETVSSMKSNIIWDTLGNFDRTVYDSQIKDDYAVLTVQTFNPFDKYTISAFEKYFKEFFLEVKENKIEKVILDVRGNGGGDPLITSNLFSYLEKQPQPYWTPEAPNYYAGLKNDIQKADSHFDGELYVLINGGCFSSTGHLLALLKYQEVGTFIGEESNGSFVCTDSSRDQSLPTSKVKFHYSTQAWAVAVEGLEPGRGIMPDHEVTNTLEDYLNKTDPVMDFALGLITN